VGDIHHSFLNAFHAVAQFALSDRRDVSLKSALACFQCAVYCCVYCSCCPYILILKVAGCMFTTHVSYAEPSL
jgi:hypothetical protein